MLGEESLEKLTFLTSTQKAEAFNRSLQRTNIRRPLLGVVTFRDGHILLQICRTTVSVTPQFLG